MEEKVYCANVGCMVPEENRLSRVPCMLQSPFQHEGHCNECDVVCACCETVLCQMDLKEPFCKREALLWFPGRADALKPYASASAALWHYHHHECCFWHANSGVRWSILLPRCLLCFQSPTGNAKLLPPVLVWGSASCTDLYETSFWELANTFPFHSLRIVSSVLACLPVHLALMARFMAVEMNWHNTLRRLKTELLCC